MSQQNTAITKGVEWSLVWIYFALCTIGIMAIFIVTYKDGDPILQSFLKFKTEYSKQAFFLLISMLIGALILLTDSKFFTATANLGYAFGLLLIFATFAIGKEVGGSKSWISFGGVMNIQPVELCKIFTSLAIAKYLSSADMDFNKLNSRIIASGIAFTPAVLSILQKETGAAIIYSAFAIAFFREGLSPIYLVAAFAFVILIIASILLNPNTLFIILTLCAAGYAYIYRRKVRRNRNVLIAIVAIWLIAVGVQRLIVPVLFEKVLKPHQLVRIFTTFGIDDYKFVSKERTDAIKKEFAKLGTVKNNSGEKVESYNVKQSKIAIGSGGFWGKGLLKGTQTKGDFVPAQNTDFIFSSIGESFGFVGCSIVLLLYIGLMFLIISIAERQRSVFSRVYAYCVAAIIFFHVVLNICMTVGLAPSPGITLPLLSYGGSSLLTFSILIFILIRLDADRQMVLR
jgi:rod shape determining protein RodA